MEKEEKDLLDLLKDFDINNLYQKGSYIDFCIQNYWTQGYILKVRPNNKYDISFILNQNQIKNIGDISNHFFGYFGEYSFKNDVESRDACFNRELYQMEPRQILQLFNIKLKKSNIELNLDIKDKKTTIKNKNHETDKKENEIGKKNISQNHEKKENEGINKEINNNDNNSNKSNISNKENKLKEEEEINTKKNEKCILNNKNEKDNKINNEVNDENNRINESLNTKIEDKEDKNSGIATNSLISSEAKTIDSSISSENNNIDNSKEQNNTIQNNNNIENNKNQKNSLIKLDKNGNLINISGYYTFQFLGGFLLDCLVIINNKLETIEIDHYLKDLFCLCLDTILYVSAYTQTNLNKLKSAMNIRKLTIISQLHAILASFEIILGNINDFYQYDFSQYTDIDEKFKIFANMCYRILIESQKINAIPLKFLFNLIIFVTSENIRYIISNFNENQLYKVFLSHIENLNENELKNIKNNELIKGYCKYIVNQIYKQPRISNANICYYSYLINCLKCNNLEKKMNALNDINEIIENISTADKIDGNFFDFFIIKNKILDFFFEESVHEEILKRANIIFKYLVSYNKLSEEILEKLIKNQKNDAMKNILCDVISELPSDKKNLTFNHLIKNLNFDENKSDIEYITRLTESCFNPSNYDEYKKLIEKYTTKEKNKKKEIKNNTQTEDNISKENYKEEYQNYYGLTLLFDYIIKDFNDKKPFDQNNVNFAIEAFNRILQFANNIELKDIYHFMDLIFDNIKSNEKHNSIIQSIIMLKKLISIFEENKNDDDEEYYVKKLNTKYNIISLIINDLIRYINILPSEDNFIVNEKEIYEGIYPHKLNIEERLSLIFIFVKGEFSNYSLKIESEDLKQLFKLFKPNKYKKEMEKLLNYLSRNLKYIENETIKAFYKDILLNKNEFDIINFTDLYELNLIKDLFYKINHDNNMIIGNRRKMRVVGENIEGLDLLFEILINNKNRIIQSEICHLLSDLFLNLKDYKSDFTEKYWKFFIEKIVNLLINLNNINNINGLKGIINLIDIIYNNCCNYDGVIPCKEDTYQIDNDYEVFQFHCITGNRKKRDYKIRVGQDDEIFYMRWKLGYYYDIPVNNVVLIDQEGKKYTFIDDNEKFFNVFPPKVYSPEGSFIQIKVIEANNILLTIKNNPKKLIEENENIFKILIDNLSNNKNTEKDIKQKIYNIIKKMPKQFYINKIIKMFGEKTKISDDIIYPIFSFNNIYILSYFLHCINYYIKNIEDKNCENNDKDKEEFMENFINAQNGEKLIYNILLLEANIDYDNFYYIQLECIIDIITLIQFINNYKNEKKLNKKNYEYIFENINLDVLLKKFSEIIISLLKIKYEEIMDDNCINYNLDYKNIIVCDSCQLLDTIIHFIDDINKENKTYYLKYLLLNQNIFKEIFLFNYITCKEDKLIEILHNYFIKHIFEDQHLIKIYLEIMLIIDVFKYLMENDTNGNYFKMLSSIMEKCHFKNQKNFQVDNISNKIINIKEEKKKEIIKKQDNNSENNIDEKKEIKNNDIPNVNKNNIINEINNEINDSNNDNKIKIEVNNEQKENDLKENKEDKDKNAKIIQDNKENNIINKDKENNNDLENIFISQFKTIIDLIIVHIDQIYNQNSNKNDLLSLSSKKNKIVNNSNNYEIKNEIIKNNKIEGIICFLQSILNLYPEELVLYLQSKTDIIELFLNKCILSKCNLNPLESKIPLCNYLSSQDSVFHLIIFILRNISSNENLYYNIIKLLSKYHQIGFWKTNSVRNWELELSEINKQKYIGLKNLASTCYMNSILQQIFMIPMLRETLLSINNPDKKNVLFQLQLLFSALKLYESQYYDPSSFVLANKLNFYEQMDADEYFGMFIDKIENDIKNIYINENENKYKELFRFFFGIKALDELKFVDCGHKRYNEFFYNNIQLEVKGFNNLYNSLKNYFKTEIMDGENKINCEGCNMKRTCHKRQIFKSLPNILVMNLKRFEFDYNTMLKSKLNNYFEFPFELDMKDYLIEDHKEINTKYELTGITIHFGFSDYGHYYDLIKSPDGKWYKFNDNCIYEFDEKDIPHEAFGEKDSIDDFMKDIEEKDNGQNNAYILIYKKQNFDIDSIENISKNYNCNLALPPYDKFSNINNEIKSIINNQMFKFWTIQSIVSPSYQNFIINLLKIDLIQNITKKSEKLHPQLFNILKEEGYEINNKIDKTDTKLQSPNNKIFEFGLKYFFNILLRIAIKSKERFYLPIFSDIIKVYIENDLNKAKFILEEFSNTEAINEYLVYCPNKSGIITSHDIIYFSFKKLFENIILKNNLNNSEISNDLDFLFQFINAYVLFISYNINIISIENVNTIFYKIIKISSIFINYLKEKQLEKWIMSFFTDDDDDDEDEEIYLNSILSEDAFPKLKSNHKILSEKTMMFNNVKLGDKEKENDLDNQNYNRLKDTSGNIQLIKMLYYDFQNVE